MFKLFNFHSLVQNKKKMRLDETISLIKYYIYSSLSKITKFT